MYQNIAFSMKTSSPIAKMWYSTHTSQKRYKSPKVRLEWWLVESWQFLISNAALETIVHINYRIYIDQYVLKVPFSMCHPLISCIIGNKAFSLQTYSFLIIVKPMIPPLDSGCELQIDFRDEQHWAGYKAYQSRENWSFEKKC